MADEPTTAARTVGYDATLETGIDTYRRWMVASPRLRRQIARQRRWFALTGAAAAVVIVMRQTTSPFVLAPVAVVVALIFYRAYPGLLRVATRRRMERVVRQTLGGRDTAPATVTIDASGLECVTGPARYSFTWHTSAAIGDDPEGVELVFQSGIVFIPSRAFASTAEQAAFAAAARDFRKRNV